MSGFKKGGADVIEFNLMDHTDEPPKGRDFGLRTRKVSIKITLDELGIVFMH